MYHRLCNKLALDTAGASGSSPEFSQAASMAGGNAVQWEAVVFHLERDSVLFQLQVSNDREQWDEHGSAQQMDGIGYKLFTAETQVAAAYVRLKYSAVSGKALLTAGINVSRQ